MSSIIYKGKVDSTLFSGVKAMLTFDDGNDLGIANVKHFSFDEARKGFEQLKRWVSTGAFDTLVLKGFVGALENANKKHILEWLEDHLTEPDFPTLIFIGESETSCIEAFSNVVNNEEELKNILNT